MYRGYENKVSTKTFATNLWWWWKTLQWKGYQFFFFYERKIAKFSCSGIEDGQMRLCRATEWSNRLEGTWETNILYLWIHVEDLKDKVLTLFQRFFHRLDNTQLCTASLVSKNSMIWRRTTSSKSLSLSSSFLPSLVFFLFAILNFLPLPFLLPLNCKTVSQKQNLKS